MNTNITVEIGTTIGATTWGEYESPSLVLNFGGERFGFSPRANSGAYRSVFLRGARAPFHTFDEHLFGYQNLEAAQAFKEHLLARGFSEEELQAAWKMAESLEETLPNLRYTKKSPAHPKY